MDHIDRSALKRTEARAGRLCEFCRELDPQFPQRKTADQLVTMSRKLSASAHLTEDGYVRHRMVELNRLALRYPRSA